MKTIIFSTFVFVMVGPWWHVGAVEGCIDDVQQVAMKDACIDRSLDKIGNVFVAPQIGIVGSIHEGVVPVPGKREDYTVVGRGVKIDEVR